MAVPTCTDDEFITLFEKHGPLETSKILGVQPCNVFARRKRLEKKLDRPISGPRDAPIAGQRRIHADKYPARLPVEVKSGVILIGSDAHYWPGIIDCAHRALVKMTKELQPKAVVLNGDVIDGAGISRHPPIGWAKKPTIQEELETAEERLSEIEDAYRKAERLYTLGNHDMRFESRLAANAHEFEGVQGFSLPERFPLWQMATSIWVNDSVVIKHRFKGGVHATHNNTLNAGKTMVTGHLHSLKVTPFSDYNGTRYGVDTGTLMDPYGPQAAYGEDNPLNHRSGFVVLTFHKGMLLWPEVVRVIDDESFEFRGQVIRV